ncbi:AbrB family transcriptional regulator [Acetobacter farinalis]|uniref:AbrB family transcriptional regulator n=1 Tax=Acetobacter farinalis TaxID=1260984 RepID=A0ABT3Q7A2_9PROT|nr:AbrB family transcriptional regulator [Acetobacter farinalis]NHO29868.1 AbrB family transcriptional regulator [Acetobacter farinalis]
MKGRSLRHLPPAGRWTVLVVASVLAAAALQGIGLPAGLMLGPLAAAALLQSHGGAVKIPGGLMTAAHAVIGCLVARSITPAILSGFVHHWPILLGVVALSIMASASLGWLMARLRIVSGTTAVWGMMPGAAPMMIVMAEACGADFRLVAFMQYLRVVMVASCASVVALLFVHGSGSRFASGYFPPVMLLHVIETVAVAGVGAALGRVSRMPAGTLLGPMALGGVLNALGVISIDLPPVVLIASYALIGWNTGQRFTREVLVAATRALPQTIGATAVLMGCCGLLAWMLVALFHIDPLTAYLATSPGGVDAAAIIAASSHVDTSFVMAVQILRVIVLLGIGPQVARWVAGTLRPRA